MTSDELDHLRSMLIGHEGLKLKVYNDTLGIPTIGVGRNLRDKGISPSEAQFLCENDIADVTGALVHLFPWFLSLSSPRQMALIDMGFMGPDKLRGFTGMIAAIQANDFQTASAQMLNSKWAAQVGVRATDLAKIMRNGVIA